MHDKLKRLFGDSRLASIVMAVFGLVLLIWPGHTLELAAKIIGIGLLAAGLLAAFHWYRNRHSVRGSAMSMTQAIIGVGAGLFVLLARRFVVGMLPGMVGILILINGAVNLSQALSLKSAGGMRWKGPLALAVLTLALGALIVMNPFRAAAMTVAAIGAVLVYNGVSNLFIDARYRKI